MIFGDRNFETTANTMTISRQGSHRKLLVEIAVIGLAHRGHVMQAERRQHTFVPEGISGECSRATREAP